MAGLALWSGFRILHRCMLSLMKLHSCADFREGEQQHPFCCLCVCWCCMCVQEQQLLHSSSHLFQCWRRGLTPLPQARRRSRTSVEGTRSRSSVYKRWPKREGAAAGCTPSPKTRDHRDHHHHCCPHIVPTRFTYTSKVRQDHSIQSGCSNDLNAHEPKIKHKFFPTGEVPDRWRCTKAVHF